MGPGQITLREKLRRLATAIAAECVNVWREVIGVRRTTFKEVFTRLLTALAIDIVCLIAAVASIGLGFVIDSLIGRAFYIADTVLFVTLLPSLLGIAIGSLAALHSERFCNWFWWRTTKFLGINDDTC